jgi:hypothetical protein
MSTHIASFHFGARFGMCGFFQPSCMRPLRWPLVTVVTRNYTHYIFLITYFSLYSSALLADSCHQKRKERWSEIDVLNLA